MDKTTHTDSSVQTVSHLLENGMAGDQARRLTIIACCAFALSVVFAIVSLRCLYADGSYQLLEVLKTGGFVHFATNRNFASDLVQFPVVAAIKLGVRNLHTLELAFGLGCFLPWPIIMLLCYRLAPRYFWVVMLACAAGYLNAAFMAVGEYIIADAFFWPVLFAILFVRPLTPPAAAILIISSVILLFSYASMLFLGLPLARLAWWRARGSERKWQRAVFYLAVLLLVSAAGIALDSVLYPQSTANFGGFQRGLADMVIAPSWTVGWTFIWIVLMTLVCFGYLKFSRRYYAVGLALLAVVIIIWGAWPILEPNHIRPDLQHDYRAVHLLVPLALLAVAFAAIRRPEWFEERRNYLIGFSAALLLAQSLWHIAATWRWHEFVGVWRREMASHRGVVPLYHDDSVSRFTDGQVVRFGWNWANPSLSIMLAPNGHVRAIILPWRTPVWQPFDPLNPQEVPDLHRYGVSYDDYVTTLEDQLRFIRQHH